MSPPENSAVLVVPPRLDATSVASGDLDSNERCTIGHSLFPCQNLLLVEWLVQLFVADTRFVPQTARRLLAPSDLPPALERVAMQAQVRLQIWFAWTQESRVWFLVADMGADPGEYCQGAAAIVSAILAMAKSLGLRVVAEGVETAAQLDVLNRQGCEVAQGFFFSRPLPAEQCRALLEELAIRPSFTETVRMRLRRGLPSIVAPMRASA